MVIFHSYVSLPEGTHNSVPNPCCTLYRLYSETTSVDLTQAWNFGTSCQSLALPQAEIPMVYFWASKWPSSCTTDFIKATMLSPCWESCVRASSRLLPFRLEDGLSAGCWKSYLNSCYSQHIWMTDQGLWRKHCYWCWCVIYIESLRIFFPPLGIQSVSSGYYWAWFLRRRVSQPSQRSSPICAASRAPPAWFDGQFQFWHFRPQGFSQSCPFQHAATHHHSMAELGSHAWLGGLTATAEGSGMFKWEMAPKASSWMLCNRLNKCFKQIVWVVFTWLKLDQLPWKPRLDPGIHVMFSWNGAPDLGQDVLRLVSIPQKYVYSV